MYSPNKSSSLNSSPFNAFLTKVICPTVTKARAGIAKIGLIPIVTASIATKNPKIKLE